MKNIDNLLLRIKQKINVKNDREMCSVLDIKYGTLDGWKNRDKIPERRLEEIALKIGVSAEWLMSKDDEDLMQKDELHSEFFGICKKIEKLIYLDEDKGLIEEKKRLVRDGLDGILIGLKGYI